VYAADVRPLEAPVETDGEGADGGSASYAGAGRILPVHLDVTSRAAVDDLREEILSGHGHLDGIVNNAAVFSTIRMAPFWEITDREWDQIMAVNLRGPWVVVSGMLGALRASAGASIVNIGSDAVALGRTRYLHYLASKGGVQAMTYGMSKELGPFGIRVNTLSPGPVYTEVDRETVTDDQRAAMLDAQALPRTAGPDDMTGLAVFLLSDASAYLTGQTISVNGGLVHR
jgi:3-oxoacyl-[acyl-carrier protein] reductase